MSKRFFIGLLLLFIFAAGSFSAAAPVISPFEFTAAGTKFQGLVSIPKKPKGLILYFHRAIEDRTAAKEWAEFLDPKGYAVACYTAQQSTNALEAARAALKFLRQRSEFTRVPVIAAGASMGSPLAADLFAEDASIAGLILLVPGNREKSCRAVTKRGSRPILLIQADQDEVVNANAQKEISDCAAKQATAIVLKETTHRFAIQKVSIEILKWLETSGSVPLVHRAEAEREGEGSRSLKPSSR